MERTMALDLSRTSAELMIERINLDNNLVGDNALKWTEVEMDLPFEVPPDADGRNASVLLLSVPKVKYRGEQTVYAKRFDADAYLGALVGSAIKLDVPSARTTHDLIARLNSVLHLAVLPSEVSNLDIDESAWDEAIGGVAHDIVFIDSYIFTGKLRVYIGTEPPGRPILMENFEALRWENGNVMTFDTLN
jgi:hypothetical protein